ncbi:MAG: hypothetical protein PHY99_04730 [Bacteroidales bacterium]|nr:hypothetical protein [Bacteroidales bacterium]
MSEKPKTILVSPLEWGLGHTVRVVTFIRDAIRDGHQVILASDGVSLDFLRYRFPDLPWVRMPFYSVRYPDDGRFFRKLIPQGAGILRSIRKNHKQVAEIVEKYQVTDIISDHRYGLYHKDVHSVFITNQLWLKAPVGWSFGEGLVYLLHRMALRKFSEIWIADFEGTPNISGKLTHPPRLPEQARFIGPVSRFQQVVAVKPDNAESADILALISGPEPQRTLLEEKLKNRFIRDGHKALIFRGIPPSSPGEIPATVHEGPVTLTDHASDEHLLWYILEAREIFCRPGNSTLCDLISLGKSATLIPTPGQTEQEYVAQHLQEQGLFTVCKQDAL